MTSNRIKEILYQVGRLAIEYRQITGKPLGVTGELAEYAAADELGLELAEARTAGYDAIRRVGDRIERIQVKGRACAKVYKPGQRIGRIKLTSDCDSILLVILDEDTLTPREMWEAPFDAITARLIEPGSKARNERGAMSIRDFKKLACKVWPAPKEADEN